MHTYIGHILLVTVTIMHSSAVVSSYVQFIVTIPHSQSDEHENLMIILSIWWQLLLIKVSNVCMVHYRFSDIGIILFLFFFSVGRLHTERSLRHSKTLVMSVRYGNKAICIYLATQLEEPMTHTHLNKNNNNLHIFHEVQGHLKTNPWDKSSCL